MIAYRIDRHNELKEFSTIELKTDYSLHNTFSKFNNSFSRHGIEYLAQNFIDSPYYGSFLWEFALEYVRVLNFPDLPSRFQSTFACKTLEDSLYWETLFQQQGFKNLKTFEISFDENNYFEGDANWFNSNGLYSSIKTSKFENASWASFLFFFKQVLVWRSYIKSENGISSKVTMSS